MIATKIGCLENLAIHIHGNCWADKELLMLAHDIAVDHRESLEVRLRALHVMDLAVGEADQLTEEALHNYHETLEIVYRRSTT